MLLSHLDNYQLSFDVRNLEKSPGPVVSRSCSHCSSKPITFFRCFSSRPTFSPLAVLGHSYSSFKPSASSSGLFKL